jgi:flagellar biosynthesis protein FlhA
MAEKRSLLASLTGGSGEWMLPVAVVSLVFVMLVPVPAWFLDLLLAVSITLSVLVLLAAVHILRPVQFSVFPSLLLLLTLFRLSLNLASSRRILLHGNEGSSAAGQVIEAFGQFVVGGNYVVGFVLFLALIAIQYMVVSHGAVRTAEVTARFTLDAMPGKQMAIDADLNAGLIDEAQARLRRQAVAQEAEFYGAMDGAARFNQRDSLATILITAINIVAGFLIGVFQLDIPFREALKTYTILTVGDGLVTMIPSLLVSVSGGIVVTRASSDSDLGADVRRQLFGRSGPLWIGSGVMLSLALIPGLPKFSFLTLAFAVALLARRVQLREKRELQKSSTNQETAAPASNEALAEGVPHLDELSLEVGYGLVALVDTKQGGQFLRRVRALRRHLALQLGFVVPSVHITDNLRLRAREYVIYLRGVEVARHEMRDDCLLAISSDPAAPAIAGVDTREPAFGVPAKWITPATQEQALAAGYAVVDQTSVMATHLAEVIKQHAHELLSRQETKRLLDRLADSHPKLVEELVPKLLTLGEVQRVLQQLLREQVSIRDLPAVLEALIEAAGANRSLVLLVEAARQALSRSLVRPLLDADGALKVVTLASELEAGLQQVYNPQQSQGGGSGLQPSFATRVLEGLKKLIGEQAALATPVILCSTPTRFYLRRLLEPFLPKIVVLSPGEIPAIVPVQSVGVLR